MTNVDYEKIGLKVGLEIHQQLKCDRKLFCDCKTTLFKGKPEITFLRMLRPTQSELGQIDPAAFFEFQKHFKILYEGNNDTACLVEMDEEPPHTLNGEALKAALIISLMFQAKPVDEIHVMRKTVIDGSNTTGFQRTCTVAFNGRVMTKTKTVPIQHVSLEEDAARKTGEDNNILHYRIDRLCIPLVEVATSPTISTPEEAKKAALTIGQILRASLLVKRGLGTIRQDLNVSINDGALVEIKGVQELNLVPAVIEKEVKRQLSLLKTKSALTKRGVEEKNVRNEFINVTHLFANTNCSVIHAALERNLHVFAVKLPKFGGLLTNEQTPNCRLGTEIAFRARFWGGVKGIFHTDELPAYGISSEEVSRLKQVMHAKPLDAIVFVADNKEKAHTALKAVNERAKEALKGVPSETRAGKSDGTTRYMRPRPGAARMYPETDVPPIQISRRYIETLRQHLPELPKQRLQRLTLEFGLNKKLAQQILNSEFIQFFEMATRETKASPTMVAVLLTETLKALKREGEKVENISHRQLQELFKLVGQGKVVKEAAEDIIVWLSKHKKAKVTEAVETLGLSMLSQAKLDTIVEDIIAENQTLVTEKSEKAYGLLMGLTMKKVRGRAKAEQVSLTVKEKLKNFK